MSLFQGFVRLAMTSLVAGASVVVQPLVASATTFDVDAVDVTVVVESDGHTTVKNIVTWNVIGGTMGGFDFMNPAIRPDAFLTKLSYAESEKKSFPRQPLKVTSTGNQSWSIDTSGKRLPEGVSYWTFYYEGNIIKSGKIGKTTNPELGDFYFFDWAPVLKNSLFPKAMIRVGVR